MPPDVPHPRIEARGFALLAARRALTQCYVALPEDRLWVEPPPGPAEAVPAVDPLLAGVRFDDLPGAVGPPAAHSLGAVAQRAGAVEGRLLWPPDLSPPVLDARPGIAGVFYALARYRGVTEERLMGASDADLDAPSPARDDAPGDLRTLDARLDALIRSDLWHAARAYHLRARLEPGWDGVPGPWRETWDAARAAYRRCASGA